MDLSALGTRRVLTPTGVLPQAAWSLDVDSPLAEDEIAIDVQRLNLDAASFRQLHGKHGGDPDAIRAEVLGIVAARGKMHNPVTGSGGMLIGTVAEVGPASTHGLSVGDAVATLVSLTLTPLRIHDGLQNWDGTSEQVPCDGKAILFGRTICARLPDDLSQGLALAVLDVCGAPALTDRVVRRYERPVVAVLGAAGKSGSLACVAATAAGAAQVIGIVPTTSEAELLTKAEVCDAVAVADARDPVAVAGAVSSAGGPADVTIVCVDVPGCEHGAILSTADGGTIIFFSMATSFSAAALGAEGMVADVTMLVGNGYLPGHADMAMDLLRGHPGVRSLFERRVSSESGAD